MTFPSGAGHMAHNGSLAVTAPDPIITIDEQSVILFANEATERVLGYAQQDLLGRSLLVIIPERLQELHSRGIARYVETSERSVSWSGIRVPVRTKSGAEIPMEVSFGEFSWDGRRVFSGFLRDISDRVAAEEALLGAHHQLEEQAAELEQQVEEARALSDELTREKRAAEARLASVARSADRARRLLALATELSLVTGAWEVARLILDAGMTAAGADAGTFVLGSRDAAGDLVFEIVAARGFSEELTAKYGRFELHSGRPVSDAVLSGAPVLIESRADALMRYPTVADVGYEAFAAVPITKNGAPVAAISFSFAAPQQFDDATDTFLRTVGEQCAQALERARLHDERDIQAARSSFLAEASKLLSSSLDYEATLGALAEAAVPTMADGCVIDVVVDPSAAQLPPTLSRIAIVHRDPARKAIALAMAERFPTDWGAAMGMGAVLRDGEVQFTPVITDAMLAATARSEEHLEAMRKLGLSSAISVPLRARGLTLGVLTLVLSESGRRYDAHDVSLATELASRAATAIDNARLFSEAQRERETAEQAGERADSANKAKSNFLATMSHEIRTPINAVLGYAELLELELAGSLNEEQHGHVARIQASTAHLLTLVNEILDLAKIESGTLRIDVAESSSGETADAALELVHGQAAAKGVKLSDRCEGSCSARYVGDPGRVRQVLANLLGNAVKFTDPGGTVSIGCSVGAPPARAKLSQGDTFVAFRVADTGIGIPADQLDDIFEAFVQAESGEGSPYTRQQSGTGLGLAISRQLAHMMGGDVIAESEPGRGSVFTLLMPAGSTVRPRD